jgi:hypothetical protein
MDQPSINKGDILIQYVKLRRDGLSAQQAVEMIKRDAFKLALKERNELGNDINQWESEHRPQGDGPAGTKPLTQREAGPAPLGAALFGMPPAEYAKVRPLATGPLLPVICPNCGTKNSPDAEDCVNCAGTLKSKQARTRMMKKPMITDDDARAAKSGRLYLQVKTRKQPLEVYVTKELIIGRSSPDSSVQPDIDLAPYEAEKYGVSRAHASLKKDGETIVITDLHSSNETHLNGERLYPQETHVLRHGDELELGTLLVKVLFKV